MIVRQQLAILKKRMEEPRRFIQVLAGPRQVGKTTLVQQFTQQTDTPVLSVSADLVEPTNKDWIILQWETVRSKMRIQQLTEYILIIDEIQRINDWSAVVKREWDADTQQGINIKVIILGSSRLLIKDGLTESLFGRFELIRMPHWTLTEMREAFGYSLDEYIYFGGYPGGASLRDEEERWLDYMRHAIVEPGIEKDVLMTKRILKPALMRQLFEMGCSYSSQELSLTKILGQLQDAGNVTTLSNYLYTLSEANLLTGLQKYSNDKARRYQSSPKFMVYNTALLSALYGKGFNAERVSPARWGRWVESAVGAYLLNQAEVYGYKLYYWRENNNEVDFVLENSSKEIISIEVKSGHRIENMGVHVFEKKFHPIHTFVVGGNAFTIEEFLSIPINQLWR